MTLNRIALVATHHAEYAANLAMALADDAQVLLILSARNARQQLLPASLTALRARLTLAIVPHHYAPLQPWIASRCRRLIARFAPDIVHLQEHPSRVPALVAAALAGQRPLVVTVHDPEPHSGADGAAARHYARSTAVLRGAADRLIVHGAPLVPVLARLLPDGDARIRSIAHGALGFGTVNRPVAPPIADGPFILFGRMNAYKGLDLLLDANDLLLAEGAAPMIVLAGAGPELERLRPRLAAAPNLRVHARFVPQDELATMVAAASAVVLPYRDATQSGVAAAAFGLGRPVIATAVGALPEVVRDGDNGLLVPPEDPQALAGAMRRLMGEPGLHQRLTEGAARTIAATLGWRAIASETRNCYGEAVNHAGGRR